MSYHTGNNNNNNRSSQPSSTPPASTPPVTPTPPPTPTPTRTPRTPTQRSGVGGGGGLGTQEPSDRPTTEPPGGGDFDYGDVCVQEVTLSGYVWFPETIYNSGVDCSGQRISENPDIYKVYEIQRVCMKLDLMKKSTCYPFGDPRTEFEPYERHEFEDPRRTPKFPNGSGQSFSFITTDAADCLTLKWTYSKKVKTLCDHDNCDTKNCKERRQVNLIWDGTKDSDTRMCCELSKEEFRSIPSYERGEDSLGIVRETALTDDIMCGPCKEQFLRSFIEAAKIFIPKVATNMAPLDCCTCEPDIPKFETALVDPDISEDEMEKLLTETEGTFTPIENVSLSTEITEGNSTPRTESSSLPTGQQIQPRNNARTYENGKRIPGNFPAAYQNSLNKAGPAGQKCGNCKLFNQKNGYCSAWKATANKNYWCQSYVPYVNITMNGAAVSSSGGVFSLRGSNNKLITYKKGTTVVYDGELYEVTKNVSGQLPDKSSSFVKITNIDDNVVDGGSFGETPSVTRTPVRRSSGRSSSSSSSGGGY